jgi:hypothetical protein
MAMAGCSVTSACHACLATLQAAGLLCNTMMLDALMIRLIVGMASPSRPVTGRHGVMAWC